MELHRQKPGPALAEFVETLWIFQGFAQAHEKERLMPDGGMALVINLQDDRSRIYDRRDVNRFQILNGCLMSGPQSEYFVIDTAEQLSVAGVQFRAGGAFPFLAMPADELQSLHVPLDALWGRFAAELRERLLEAGSAPQQFRVLEDALLARLQRPLVRHPAVEYALREFRCGRGTVAEVIEKVGLSPRRFIEVFRQQVGLTPKVYCRIRRFQDVLRRISAGNSSGKGFDWAQIALDCGYFDQAHFNHDFRAFSGIKPTSYAEERPRHMNHVPIRDAGSS
jgi:AraC-like DNA-binding protein